MTKEEARSELYKMLIDGIGNAEAVKVAIYELEKKTCGNCIYLNTKKRNSLGYMCEHPERPFCKGESRNACIKPKYQKACSKWQRK